MTSVSGNLQEQLQLALGKTYQLERELGGGGMSRVFVAQERALGRRVVVKVLLPELAAGVNVERFRREIQLAAQLQHPHIVPLLSAGEADGLPYFVMPFVTGESLRTRLTREGEFPIADTVRILRDVVSALAYAHGFGVVHRDIKPDNVLLSHGVAVVTDFGVAKAVSASSGSVGSGSLTSQGVALGTPSYMAPEQATASPQTDHRADIYSLGIMAYEMLTGSPPFFGRPAQAVLAAHVVEDPEPVERRRPAVPPMLATLVKESLCKRPADRPQSATQIMQVLDAIVTPSGGTAATTAVRMPAAPAAMSPPRRRWAVVGALVLALLLAGAALLVRRNRRPDTSAAVATQSQPAGRVNEAAITPVPPTPAPPETPPPPKREPRKPSPQRALPRPAAPAAAMIPADTNLGPRADSVAVDSSPVAVTLAPPAPLPPPAESARPAPAPVVNPPQPRRPPEPAPVDPRQAVRGVLAQYAGAIQARSLADLRRVYPGMTPVQQRGWEQFFQLVRDVKTELSISQLEVTGGAAETKVVGTYTYLNTSTGQVEHQPVAFQATFRQEAGIWRMSQVH